MRRLAAKWCAEPFNVHGGKKRPKGARLVVYLSAGTSMLGSKVRDAN